MSKDATPSSPAKQSEHDGTVIDTVQSLIVAFVLAMTFRGFVTEGFVIPTGSMAPTLMGQHFLVRSDHTGLEFAVNADRANMVMQQTDAKLFDPTLGPLHRATSKPQLSSRMGDRVLVFKLLYPFAEPQRFDVVVFKNPTDPTGEAANYIKRLIGLPNEQIWLCDGDVFARPEGTDEFQVQRKPEHVQRTAWQQVYHSDFVPLHADRLEGYAGQPWVGDESHWTFENRRYRFAGGSPSALRWDHRRLPITDFTPYNMLHTRGIVLLPVSDLRVSAGIVADQLEFATTFELEARHHIFQFIIERDANSGNVGTARVRMRPQDDPDGWVELEPASVRLPSPGRVFNVEFWHVDQSMQMFIDGRAVFDEPLYYNWSPIRRLQLGSGYVTETNLDELLRRPMTQPQLRWHFSGSPVTLHRVRVDRDLHYRQDVLRRENQKNPPYINGPAFGTHPYLNAAVLKSDQYMMLGDNSQMSSDSRLWGSPHPLIASQIDEDAFVVNRKLLLGKAWVVYFPAPYSLRDGGTAVIPDFGRLRFIR